MRTNKNFYWLPSFSNILTNKNSNVITAKKPLTLIRAFTLMSSVVITLFCSSANAVSITAEMSPEIIAEYKKQLSLQEWPAMHTKLALMGNPYKASYRALKKTLKAEAPEGKRYRLKTTEESTFVAKKMRFDYCQASVSFFVEFAKKAYDLSTIEVNPLTEEQLMSGNGVTYPFTKEETNNGNLRPTQIALSLGWKYKGKGEQYAEAFLATCLAEPTSLYYKEDK